MSADWLSYAISKITRMTGVQTVPGYIKPPAHCVVETAKDLARHLFDAGIEPRRISHSAEGGISFVFDSVLPMTLHVDADDGTLVFIHDRSYEIMMSMGMAVERARSALCSTNA